MKCRNGAGIRPFSDEPTAPLASKRQLGRMRFDPAQMISKTVRLLQSKNEALPKTDSGG
jgi:hypothetical protein